MIKNPATSVVVAVILVGGLAISPLLDIGELREFSSANAPENDPLPAQSPQFQIHWQQDELLLSGHTASLGHEQHLLRVANSSYPDDSVIADFQALGIVPSHWEDATVQVLYLLSESASAQADLSANKVSIRGVTVDELAWQSRLGALQEALPPHVSIRVDTVFVDSTVNVLEVCKRAFAHFDAGPINFEESSADFRSSAYPRLDRVIALANTCADSKISVTGHTDSSGSESWNQVLSLKRANAVGDYIVRGGVDRSRMQVSGAGSTTPIADDRTRYGRSLNRRIELSLTNVK